MANSITYTINIRGKIIANHNNANIRINHPKNAGAKIPTATKAIIARINIILFVS